MLRVTSLLLASALLLSTTLSAQAAKDPNKATKSPAMSPADAEAFKVQGEYVGTLSADGKETKFGAQIIALGEGKFHAVGYVGGLPGEGWDGGEKHEADGKTKDGQVVFEGNEGVTAVVKDEALTVKGADGNVVTTLKKVLRKGPTLGVKPPEGAIVLFDGTSADKFQGGKMTEDGLLMEGDTSKQKFQSYTIHLEFRTPFEPKNRGQGRGNSGYYCQGRYEVQILDSFGLKGENNECGGIYGVSKPLVNMCYPPMSWQTYDVDFTAAEYKDGKKVKNARMTVRHNGVPVQKDVEVPKGTTAHPVPEGPEPGPVYLQNHGNPVRFRNIWVLEKK
jgi:hypothetical protein